MLPAVTQRKIGRKLKSKQLADIHYNTQIINVECAKVNGTQNGNIKKYVTYSNKEDHSHSSILLQMTNAKYKATSKYSMDFKNKKETT